MLRSLAQQSEEKGLSGTASLPAPPCYKYGQSARPLAEGLLRITKHAASQPNSGRLGDFCPQTHPACLTPWVAYVWRWAQAS